MVAVLGQKAPVPKQKVPTPKRNVPTPRRKILTTPPSPSAPQSLSPHPGFTPGSTTGGAYALLMQCCLTGNQTKGSWTHGMHADRCTVRTVRKT